MRNVPRLMLMAALLAGSSACHWLQNAPESRARDYVRALVVGPDDLQHLRAVAGLAPDGPSPDSLIADLDTRVAITYLRLNYRRGRDLAFVIGRVQRPSARDRLVEIIAQRADSAPGDHPEVRFSVELQADADGAWHIVRVTAAD